MSSNDQTIPTDSTPGTPKDVAEVRAHLRRWAVQERIPFDVKDYTGSTEANFFEPPSPEVRTELTAGSGSELGGKIRALHSSSALVLNMFAYWRTRDPALIAQACDLDGRAPCISFESKHPYRLKGVPPHLDVEITTDDRPAVGIESKFLEPYTRPKRVKTFYGAQAPWTAVEMPSGAKLAQAVLAGTERFESLDVGQLLAHLLGLASSYGKRGFRLLYVWYEIPGRVADLHRDELARFADFVAEDASFASITHQQLFSRVRAVSRTGAADFIRYLGSRYFPGT